MIPKFKYVKLVVASFTMTLLLNACGTVEKISQDEIKTRYANLSAEKALKITDDLFNKAVSEQYDYYSPQNWTMAGEALAKAKKIAKLVPNSQEIFKHTFLVERRIDSAQYTKDRITKNFSELFKAKKILTRNKATASFKKDYTDIEKKLVELISNYESITLGKSTENVSQRSIDVGMQNLLKSMRALNVNVVKHNYLSADIHRMKQIEKRDAKNIAPVSHQQALTALAAANKYIEKNAHNKTGVKRISNKFSFSVSHLDHITNEIIALSKADIRSLENVVLNQENYLRAIGQALSGVDVRNLPIASQAESVIKTANNVLDHHAEKSTMIVELSEKNLKLQNQLKKKFRKDVGSTGKLKSKIKLLEIDIQALEEEREKLKEDLFALQQKNIDLAIQNAKLLADMKPKQSEFNSRQKNEFSRKMGRFNATKKTVSQVD